MMNFRCHFIMFYIFLFNKSTSEDAPPVYGIFRLETLSSIFSGRFKTRLSGRHRLQP